MFSVRYERKLHMSCRLILVSFLGAFAKLRKATISFVVSVRLSAWNSALTGKILMEFDNSVFFESLLRKFKFH